MFTHLRLTTSSVFPDNSIHYKDNFFSKNEWEMWSIEGCCGLSLDVHVCVSVRGSRDWVKYEVKAEAKNGTVYYYSTLKFWMKNVVSQVKIIRCSIPSWQFYHGLRVYRLFDHFWTIWWCIQICSKSYWQ